MSLTQEQSRRINALERIVPALERIASAQEVLAAAAALDETKAELKLHEDFPTWGNNSVADSQRQANAEARKPILERRSHLLATVRRFRP